jgi:hypothetical protein
MKVGNTSSKLYRQLWGAVIKIQSSENWDAMEKDGNSDQKYYHVLGPDMNLGRMVGIFLEVALFSVVPNRQGAILRPPSHPHPSCCPASFLA